MKKYIILGDSIKETNTEELELIVQMLTTIKNDPYGGVAVFSSTGKQKII